MDAEIIGTSTYIAALRNELQSAGRRRRASALVNQKVLFPHRGQATLEPECLELDGWDDRGAIRISPSSVFRITRQFDSEYGAFVGGASSKWGAPVIIELTDGTAMYVLFNHRAFLEKTDNPHWEDLLLTWLRASKG